MQPRRNGKFGSLPVMERIESKIAKSDGCWEWVASKNERGYGNFFLDGKVTRAHRAYYILKVGAIPEGLEVDHLCRNRGCVRIDHLEVVSHQENSQRTIKHRRPRRTRLELKAEAAQKGEEE